MKDKKLKTSVYVVLALCAFAGNSVLCRLAIGSGDIDAGSFTILRLAAGALALSLILVLTKKRSSIAQRAGSWFGALSLFVYAASFSYAYILLDTGVGALILFGTVQITAVCYGWIRGETLGLLKAVGLLFAFSGLVYLLLPNKLGLDQGSISVVGFLLMSLSGLAWGIYTILGRSSAAPLPDTASNFVRSLPFAAALLIAMFVFSSKLSLSYSGIFAAVASGALTSGLGYTIWYLALPKLTSIQSGVFQLSVPLIAAFGGLIFVGEDFGFRLLLSMLLTLSGIALVVLSGSKFRFLKFLKS